MFQALIDKSIAEHGISPVVVKVGSSISIKKDYDIGCLLHSKVPGFGKYICYFSCNDDIRRYRNILPSHICNGPGDSMHTLLMEHIPDGDVKGIELQSDIVRSCFKQVILSLYCAHEKIGLIHQDMHVGNVLLKKVSAPDVRVYTIAETGEEITVPVIGYSTHIIDFEDCLFDLSYTRDRYLQGQNLMRSIQRFVADFEYKCQPQSPNYGSLHRQCTDMSYNPHLLRKDVLGLLKAVDTLDILGKRPPPSLTYNPNVFG